MPFQTYLDNWHGWLADEYTHPLSVDLPSGELVGFMLIRCTGGDEKVATLEFIVIRPDCRYQGYGTEAVQEAIESSAAGTPSDPYQVISAMEARAFLLARDESPIGSMYVSTDDDPFVLQILARKDERPPAYRAFDLERFYRRVQADASRQMEATPAEVQRGAAPARHGGGNVSFGIVNLFLAMQRGDSAAQVFVGYSLAREERFEEAATWLVPASKGGNLVATLSLAQMPRSEAFTGTGEERDASLEKAEDHYLMAVAAGSDEAMAGLGALYVGGFYGGGMWTRAWNCSTRQPTTATPKRWSSSPTPTPPANCWTATTTLRNATGCAPPTPAMWWQSCNTLAS